MCIWRLNWNGSSIFTVIEFANMINTVCDHFIGLLQIISYTKVCAASLSTKYIIIVMSEDDKYDGRQFLEPFHLTH